MPRSVFRQCLRNGNRQFIIKKIWALLTDLLKASDCLSHDFLIANLKAYGFIIDSLRLIQDYLSNCKQRTGTNSAYSSWEEILFGVSQRSTSFYVIYFSLWMTLILQVMQMIIHHTL